MVCHEVNGHSTAQRWSGDWGRRLRGGGGVGRRGRWVVAGEDADGKRRGFVQLNMHG